MNDSSWIGRSLGDRYQIRELLGRGGMAAVYKAQDPNLRRVVAIKIIASHLSNEAQFVQRFEAEAAAVASLRHPNIIQVYDFNNDDDTYYIVFEFIPGESLQARLQRLNDADRQLPLRDVTAIASNLADALQYAHSRGIIHRDLKPANVMLNVHGQAILMDFGLVKIMGGESHTATGAVMGTALYMSPEQIKGHTVDARTDIYSLGVLLYEMVANKPPFVADSALTLMMMHVNDPVPDLKQLRADIPPDLVAVINKALAKDREDRYQSAADLAAALKNIGSDASEKAAAAAGAAAVAMPADTLPYPSSTEPPASPTPKSERSPAAPAPSSPQASKQPAGASTKPDSRNRNLLLVGGIVLALFLVLCIGGAGIILGSGMLSGGSDEDKGSETVVARVPEDDAVADDQQEADPTQTPPAADTIEVLAPEDDEPTATHTREASPSDTPEPPPTVTTEPSPTATAVPTEEIPTPTLAAGPSVAINSIGLDGVRYVVDYTPSGYTPTLPGMHIHFFFDTVPPENAGAGPTQETWFLYAGPNPFTGYTVNDRPAGATQICNLVANPDHTVQLGTGNCAPLP